MIVLASGERGGDLSAQRIDLVSEVGPPRADVVGDLLDLVFVFIGQKTPRPL